MPSDHPPPSSSETSTYLSLASARCWYASWPPGVGPWDGWIRSGKSVLPQPLPLTLGSDLSGVVEAVGPEVTAFTAGDEVYGVTNKRFIGAYAEHAIVSADMMARKPASLDHIDAASVPVIAVTAWQALYREADLKAWPDRLWSMVRRATWARTRCSSPIRPGHV